MDLLTWNVWAHSNTSIVGVIFGYIFMVRARTRTLTRSCGVNPVALTDDCSLVRYNMVNNNLGVGGQSRCCRLQR
jgi:hypothetical protein